GAGNPQGTAASAHEEESILVFTAFIYAKKVAKRLLSASLRPVGYYKTIFFICKQEIFLSCQII
ncbi:hypothetical protein DXA36_25280, partial [Eisenbergiella sp. OF01-20]|uniref:hypothetical protein n=1 Tax=Eisenbergiella sp. OF01-20 TaxID=2292348 RepID=UPI000FED2F8C